MSESRASCPKNGIFLARANVFGTDLFTGTPQLIFLDCNGCLTNEEMQAIARTFGIESGFIIGTQPVDGMFDVVAVSSGGSLEGTSGTIALAAAEVIRDLLLCGQGDEVVINFIGGAVRDVTFSGTPPTPSFTVGPTELGVIASDAAVADFLACLGLSPANLAPGLPVQFVPTGFPTIVVPLANDAATLAALDALNADETVLCVEALKVAMGFTPPTPENPCPECIGVELFTQTTVSPNADIHVRDFGGCCFTEDPISAGPNLALTAYLANYNVLGPLPIDVTIEQDGAFVLTSATAGAGGTFVSVGGSVFIATQENVAFTCGSPIPPLPA